MSCRESMNKLICRLAGYLYARVSPKALPLTPQDLGAMRISFSQFGEDLVVAEHLLGLRRSRRGIYVDAGCFDPFRYSNTRLLNLLGWRGINIDASVESIRSFEKHRPGDDNVCAALDREEKENEFVHAGSGAGSRLAVGASPLPERLPVNSRIAVRTRTLASVLADSPLRNEPVDFLDIDCEGADLAVFQGFPMETKRPVVICIESHFPAEAEEAAGCLLSHDYREVCRRGPSLIFRDNRAV